MNRRKIAMKGKNQGPNSKDEKVITLFETDIHIVAYRGNVCNQKGSPRVHWNIGKLHVKKIKDLNQDIRKFLHISS